MGEAKIDFDHNDLDMAVYIGDQIPDGVESYLIHRYRVVPVCSPKLLENEPPLETMDDLKKLMLIHVTSRKNEWTRMMQHAGASMTGLEKGLSFSSTQLALGAALEGLGVALSDRALLARELQYGQLVIPVDQELVTGKSFYLVYSKSQQLTYGMRVFRDWLLEVMEITAKEAETSE